MTFSSGTRQWSIIPIVGDIIPSARDGHSACVIDNRMYIFGGFEDQVTIFLLIVFPWIFSISRVNNSPMIFIITISNDLHGFCILLMYDPSMISIE